MKKILILTAATVAVALSSNLWTGCRTSHGVHEEQAYLGGTEASRTEVPRYQRTEPTPKPAAPAPAAAPKPAVVEASNEFTLKSDLLQLNNLSARAVIQPGLRLRVY